MVTKLTNRERQIMALVAQGKTNKMIAAEIGIVPGTVSERLKRIFKKLNVHTRTAAAMAVVARGEVEVRV